MELRDVKFNFGAYYHAGRDVIVRVISNDFDDGACLLAETMDEDGDVYGDLIFRTEAWALEECTRERWDSMYPPDRDCVTYDEIMAGDYIPPMVKGGRHA